MHKTEFMLNPNNALYNKYGQCPCCRSENSPARASKIALVWIRWVAKMKGWNPKDIQTITNGGEFHIKGIGFVDGFHAKSKTVLEFHGDDWHGNPRKHKQDKMMFTGKTAGELYKATVTRDRKILKAGYRLITMWEMDWKSFAS